MNWKRMRSRYYSILNYIGNIWRYRKLFSIDWPCSSESILCFLEIKLSYLISHWEEGPWLPYEGQDTDLADMKKAYHALMEIKRFEEIETDILFADLDYHIKKKAENMDTLFDTLKKYENWWN